MAVVTRVRIPLSARQKELLDALVIRHRIGTVAEPEEFLVPAALDPGLSVRELEVLQHVAAGETNTEIAGELVVSTETVKSHLRHILQKLDARSRAHAVALGYKHGLLDLVD